MTGCFIIQHPLRVSGTKQIERGRPLCSLQTAGRLESVPRRFEDKLRWSVCFESFFVFKINFKSHEFHIFSQSIKTSIFSIQTLSIAKKFKSKSHNKETDDGIEKSISFGETVSKTTFLRFEESERFQAASLCCSPPFSAEEISSRPS